MEQEYAAFLQEKERIEQMPDAEKKAFYERWLKVHTEKTTARVSATLEYAKILYREGAFRKVMEALMPVVMNHHAYPFCEDMITCFNQMGLAVNCEVEYALARHFFQLALELAEEHHITSVYAKQHNNIGLTYHDQANYEAAVHEYELADKWLPETSLPEIIYPMVYGNWAVSLLRLHRWQDALEKFCWTLKYQPTGEPLDADSLSIGMIIYYNLGMQEEYQDIKREFLATIEKQEVYSNVYYRLWKFKIDADDEEFTATIFRHLENAIDNYPEGENWRSKCNACDMLYARAQEKSDTAAMLKALTRKIEFQNEATEILEKKRQDALNEYIDISAEKQEALERAENATRAKSQFLSNMSHDIRTPMNAIYGITQLMGHDKGDPEKMDDHIHKLQSSSQHLLSLINDVLDMSKIESTEVTLNREPINLADQVAQIKSIVYPQTEEHKQNFTIRLHDICHEALFGDPVRLRQILINLLSNAIKYTPNGGSIALDLTETYDGSSDQAQYAFAVTDTGCGMTEEFMQHIFEPFTRAENSMTNKIQGTGLGMAITKNIVDLMGGTITLQSELGKGSCFTVTIPMDIDEEKAPQLPVDSVLLLAQDEGLVHNLTLAFAETDTAFHSVETIAEAEEFLAAAPADVIMLAGTYSKEKIADTASRLKAAAGKAELVFCMGYEQKEPAFDTLQSCGIRKILSRPIFLTELAGVLDYIADDAATSQNADTVLHGMNFLCAEDNALNAEILEAVLEMEGAACTILPDGKQIAEKFKSVQPGEYDAILMDMQMPVMNGLDATRAIRHSENPLGKTIPIIAMTANAFSSDVQDCLNAGMDAHLSKPLDIKALKQTIHTVLSHSIGGGDRCPLQEDKNSIRPSILAEQAADMKISDSCAACYRQQEGIHNESESNTQTFSEGHYL